MATDVAASLPDLLLPPGATITVTMDDAAAVITKLNVFGPSGVITITPDETTVTPLFAYDVSA